MGEFDSISSFVLSGKTQQWYRRLDINSLESLNSNRVRSDQITRASMRDTNWFYENIAKPEALIFINHFNLWFTRNNMKEPTIHCYLSDKFNVSQITSCNLLCSLIRLLYGSYFYFNHLHIAPRRIFLSLLLCLHLLTSKRYQNYGCFRSMLELPVS